MIYQWNRTMPLQNRVTPTGDIIVDPKYGALMGNRGVLHDNKQKLGTRRWTSRAWIVCLLKFKGTRRTLMSPGCYTELFFLDEATALAAGHRPCAECRRADYNAFRAAWAAAHSNAAAPRAPEMDSVLHAHRVEPHSHQQITYRRMASALPDGTFIQFDGRSWLIHDGRLNLWSSGGYLDRRPIPECVVTVLTPTPTVHVLANGYPASVHASVNAG